MAKARIGLMGGSFNPIHQGHMAMAACAMKSAGLEKVLFVPSGNPPHKHITIVTNAQRYQMVIAAAGRNKNYLPSRIELDREGIVYSVDTLKELKLLYPNSEICFIIGEDTLYDLTTWREYETVFALCTFLVVRRKMTKDVTDTFRQKAKALLKWGAKIEAVDMPLYDASSTAIRAQLQAGVMPDTLPEPVAAYIAVCGLYGYPAWLTNAVPLVDKLSKALSPMRFSHSLSVCAYARRLAQCHGVDVYKAMLAALLHDCAKCIPLDSMAAIAKQHGLTDDPTLLASDSLLHALAGEYIAKVEYNIQDEAVLQAIACHTVGREGMTTLDMVVYLSDKLDLGRKPYKGLDDLRMLAEKDLKAATLASMQATVDYLKADQKQIHPAVHKAISFLQSSQA